MWVQLAWPLCNIWSHHASYSELVEWCSSFADSYQQKLSISSPSSMKSSCTSGKWWIFSYGELCCTTTIRRCLLWESSLSLIPHPTPLAFQVFGMGSYDFLGMVIMDSQMKIWNSLRNPPWCMQDSWQWEMGTWLGRKLQKVGAHPDVLGNRLQCVQRLVGSLTIRIPPKKKRPCQFLNWRNLSEFSWVLFRWKGITHTIKKKMKIFVQVSFTTI